MTRLAIGCQHRLKWDRVTLLHLYSNAFRVHFPLLSFALILYSIKLKQLLTSETNLANLSARPCFIVYLRGHTCYEVIFPETNIKSMIKQKKTR